MIYKTLQRRTDNNNGQKKTGTMIHKTLQRRTDNNNGQKKTGKQWSTKHYKDVQTITMVKRKRTNNDLQNTTKTYRQ